MNLIKRVILQLAIIVLLICSIIRVQPIEASPEINYLYSSKISQTHTKQRSTCLMPMSLPKAGDAKASLPKMRRIGLSPEQYQMKTSQKHSSKHTKLNAENIEKDNLCSHNDVLPQQHMKLLYSLVQAEAGNQDLDGCRLVADVVLNRIDSKKFPNTMEEVIYAPGQFSVVRNGSLEKARGEISEKVIQAVDMELSGKQLNNDVLYFNNRPNGGWKYGGHYFK